MRKTLLTGAGGVAAAFLGSLCCVGPLLFVTLGVGAGFASAFEPLRPVFGALMVLLLGAGFWAVYGRGASRTFQPTVAAGTGAKAVCEPGMACAAPVRRTRDVAVLWAATVLALVLWTFPMWSLWLL